MAESRATTEIAELLVLPAKRASPVYPDRRERWETVLTARRDSEVLRATTERSECRAKWEKEVTPEPPSHRSSYWKRPGLQAHLVRLAETASKGLQDHRENLDLMGVPEFKEIREITEVMATLSKVRQD